MWVDRDFHNPFLANGLPGAGNGTSKPGNCSLWDKDGG
jgi:hypothetical protein